MHKTQLSVLIGLLCLICTECFIDHQYKQQLYGNISEILRTGYDKNQIPDSENTTWLPVYVDLHVESLSSISIVDMEFKIDFILRQRWKDNRLTSIVPKNISHLPISYLKHHIWVPDLFFRNAKQGILQSITNPNYLMWLYPDGTVLLSQKLSITASCYMDLKTFPVDTQKCSLNIGSYGYAFEHLRFKWLIREEGDKDDSRAVVMNSQLEISEFALQNHEAIYCDKMYATTGAFSCLEVQFSLKRRIGFYLAYLYIPSILVVLISWISFFIDSASAPARVSIGLLCVLALITQSATIVTQLPRVSYVKAIDIWMFVCLAFVVCSFIEYSVVDSIARWKKNVSNKHNFQFSQENTECVCLRGTKETKYRTTSVRAYQDAQKIDRMFAIGYPPLFLLFNIVYWSTFV